MLDWTISYNLCSFFSLETLFDTLYLAFVTESAGPLESKEFFTTAVLILGNFYIDGGTIAECL